MEEDKEGVYVYFWCQGLLLGRKTFGSSELPLSSRALSDEAIRSILPAVAHYLTVNSGVCLVGLSYASSALDRPLEGLSERLAPDDASEAISVIICTRDRPAHLRECLKSLERLSDRPEEILVWTTPLGRARRVRLLGSFPVSDTSSSRDRAWT